jgi:hypothetical protein
MQYISLCRHETSNLHCMNFMSLQAIFEAQGLP